MLYISLSSAPGHLDNSIDPVSSVLREPLLVFQAPLGFAHWLVALPGTRRRTLIGLRVGERHADGACDWRAGGRRANIRRRIMRPGDNQGEVPEAREHLCSCFCKTEKGGAIIPPVELDAAITYEATRGGPVRRRGGVHLAAGGTEEENEKRKVWSTADGHKEGGNHGGRCSVGPRPCRRSFPSRPPAILSLSLNIQR